MLDKVCQTVTLIFMIILPGGESTLKERKKEVQ